MITNANTTQQVNILELCAGYGGLGYAIKRVIPNAEVVLYSEWDTAPCEMLLRRMQVGEIPPAPIWTDLRTLPWESLAGKVDILTGGFPCQSFSSAGKRLADADPRHLFPHFKRAIRAIQPAIVFLENVQGILSAKLSGDGWEDPAGTPIALHVIRELQRSGYKAQFGVFSAEETGLPHQRKRVFFLAVREDIWTQGVGNSLRPDEPKDTNRRKECIHERIEVRDISGSSSATEGVSNALCSGHGRGNIGSSGKEASEPNNGNEFRQQATGHGRVAGFGAEQYAHEYPRTCHPDDKDIITPIGYGKDLSSSKELEKVIGQEKGGVESAGVQETQHPDDAEVIAPVGSTVDGDTSVVGFTNTVLCDPYYRKTGLRMCGNGVVPATAELAFRKLWEELCNSKD